MRSEEIVWILEDDLSSQFVYREILDFRYSIKFFETIESFVDYRFKTQSNPDLLIADLRLPDGNFLEFLGREESIFDLTCPFIVISSMDDLDVLRVCYQEGALDYLIKPFKKNELIVRVEQVLMKQIKNKVLISHDISVDSSTFRVTGDEGIFAQLTAKELQIFSVLNRTRGKAVDRKIIQMEIWGDVTVGTKTLDVHLFHLRKKLEKVRMEIRHIPPQSFTLLTNGVDP